MALTTEQYENLELYLVTGFDEHSLERMVKFKLSKDLFTLVKAGSKKDVAFDLIKVAEQEGWTVPLVQAVYLSLPGREDVREFVERNWPDLKESREAGEQVRVVRESLETLQGKVHLLGTLSAQVIESRIRHDLQIMYGQIDALKDYNTLVDHLVDLSTRFLRSLTEAVEAYRKDEKQRGLLQAAAQELQAEATRLLGKARRLRTYRVEKDWIDSLDQAAALMLKGQAGPEEASLQSGLAIFRRVVLEEPPRITSRLFDAAGNLDLQGLCSATIDLCDHLSQIASSTPVDFPVQELQVGLRLLLRLEPRLTGLVEEYFEWQWVDKECVLADTFPGRSPADRFPRWDSFRNRLQRLCSVAGGKVWANTLAGGLKELAEVWDSAKPALFDPQYNRFRGMIVSHFLSLSGQLYFLIEQLTQVALPLNKLLETMPRDANDIRPTSGVGR
jgi:hypothetical protein